MPPKTKALPFHVEAIDDAEVDPEPAAFTLVSAVPEDAVPDEDGNTPGFLVDGKNQAATVEIADNDDIPDAVIGTAVWIDAGRSDLATQELGDHGAKVLVRRESVTEPVAVTYTLGGSAVPWADYVPPGTFDPPAGGTITFAAGQEDAWASFETLINSGTTANTTALFTLVPGAGYTVPADKSAATIAIYNSDPYGPADAGGVNWPWVHFGADSDIIYDFTDPPADPFVTPHKYIESDLLAAEGDPVDDGAYVLATGLGNPQPGARRSRCGSPT